MSRHSTDKSFLRLLFAALLTLTLAGCGGGAKVVQEEGEAPVEYPSDATTRYARALGFMDARDDARAIVEFEKLVESYPEYSGPHVNLGIIHNRNGRPDVAMLELQRAVEICSGCAVAYNQLGIVQRQEGLFAEAERSYLAAIAADPDYALAYLNLGVLYDLYRGRTADALRYYEEFKARRRPEAIDQKDVVDKWIIDLKRRVGAPPQSAEAGE